MNSCCKLIEYFPFFIYIFFQYNVQELGPLKINIPRVLFFLLRGICFEIFQKSGFISVITRYETVHQHSSYVIKETEDIRHYFQESEVFGKKKSHSYCNLEQNTTHR